MPLPREVALAGLVVLALGGEAGAGVQFVRTDSEDYRVASSYAITYPVSIFARIKVDSVVGGESLGAFAYSNSSSSVNFAWLGTQGARALWAISGTDAASVVWSAVDSVSAGTWYHVVAVESLTSRKLYLNGVETTESTSENAPAGVNLVSIGAAGNYAITSGYMNGIVADVVVIQNYTATQADATAYAAGLHPYKLRFGNLTNYWPIDAHNASGALDRVGSLNLSTVNGTPASAESPPIHRPGPQYSRHPALAPGYYRPAPRLRDDQENYHALAA